MPRPARLAADMSDEKKTAVRDYGSPYEKLVMTTPHPEPQFKPLDPPPYISGSTLSIWIQTRWEEVVVIVMLAMVIGYCALFYTGAYWSFVFPMKKILGGAWDVAIASFLLVKYVPLDRKLRKQARMPLFALCAAVSAVRWYEPALYPSFYPWQ